VAEVERRLTGQGAKRVTALVEKYHQRLHRTAPRLHQAVHPQVQVEAPSVLCR
jgi:hypothetical protein